MLFFCFFFVFENLWKRFLDLVFWFEVANFGVLVSDLWFARVVVNRAAEASSRTKKGEGVLLAVIAVCIISDGDTVAASAAGQGTVCSSLQIRVAYAFGCKSCHWRSFSLPDSSTATNSFWVCSVVYWHLLVMWKLMKWVKDDSSFICCLIMVCAWLVVAMIKIEYFLQFFSLNNLDSWIIFRAAFFFPHVFKKICI